jgi:hypothetical protein
MMAAARISETSINFYETTRRNIPEDNHHLTDLHFRNWIPKDKLGLSKPRKNKIMDRHMSHLKLRTIYGALSHKC